MYLVTLHQWEVGVGAMQLPQLRLPATANLPWVLKISLTSPLQLYVHVGWTVYKMLTCMYIHSLLTEVYSLIYSLYIYVLLIDQYVQRFSYSE